MIRQRLRIGLGRDYHTNEAEIPGVRGRVGLTDSLKRMSFQHGRAYCRFQVFSANVPKNQIVRSTIARLVTVGDFGPVQKEANDIKSKLHQLVRDMDVADLIELKADNIRREQLKQHNADYALMLAICYLINQRHMPTELEGENRLPRLDRDAMRLFDVYERFVAKF